MRSDNDRKRSSAQDSPPDPACETHRDKKRNQDNWNYLVRNAYQFRYEWDRTISQYLLTFGET